MTSLTNKRIILGVTGGIAAYKSAELIRRLQDAGAEVRVIMTKAAQEFITPLTMQALSGNPVHTELLDPEAEAGMGHIELARWADLLLVAPASADFIARLAQGIGNDLLTTVCLATNTQLALAPAMNQAMYRNTNTQANLAHLAQQGKLLWGPDEGSQACGDIGPGRMSDVASLVDSAARVFNTGILSGKTVLITAGPTREAIDPVRYISNHSSGKMGYALAQACVDAGAKTILISGPSNLTPPERCTFLRVESAQQMLELCHQHFAACDLFIGAAAVADFRPKTYTDQKVKKTAEPHLVIELVKNPDIIATLAAQARIDTTAPTFMVGFAAETQRVVSYARDKLKRKHLDLVIANDVSVTDIGFNSDDNAVTLVWPDTEQTLAQRSKTQLARDLIALIGPKLPPS